MKRKGFLFFVVILGMFLIAGCNSTESNGTGTDEDSLFAASTWHYFWNHDVIGNAGQFYFDSTSLRFFDGESGQDIIICDDVDCDHDTESCSAYFNASIMILMPESDKMRFVSDLDTTELGDVSLYECSLNGDARKKITDFSTQMQRVDDALWTEDYIILAYANLYDENYMDLEKMNVGVFLYDRREKEGHVLWETDDASANVSLEGLSEDVLYISYHYSIYNTQQMNELYDAGETDKILSGISAEEHSLNLKTGEDQIITTKNLSDMVLASDGVGAFVLVDAQQLEYWPIFADGDEQESEEVLTVPKTQSIELLESYVDGMQFLGVYDGELSSETCYSYSEKTGEVKELGDMTDYSITAIFPEKVYLWDLHTEDGHSINAVMDYEDFLQADYSHILRSDFVAEE